MGVICNKWLLYGRKKTFKGSDWLCKVVELSMQYYGKLLAASFETYKTFERSVNPEFERKVDVQNS